MRLLLQRHPSTEVATVGDLFVDGRRECYVIEDPVRPAGEKVYGKTAIPAGEYGIVITVSPRFGVPMPLLLDVPGFQGVRIHPGNTAADTEGCLLPGTTLAPNENELWHSRTAYNALFKKIQMALDAGERVTIEIKNAESV